MSSIICGTQIPAIQDEFNVGESLDQKPELTDRQQAELDSMEGYPKYFQLFRNSCKNDRL